MSAYLGKDKLVFDPAYTSDSDNAGAYVRASDGTLITHSSPVKTPASVVIQDLTFTAACTEFDTGDAITVAYTNPGVGPQAIAVTVLGQAISVSLETDITPAIISTAANVKAAIEASLAASSLVSVAVSGVGTNIQAAQIATQLDTGTPGTVFEALDVHPVGSPHNGQFHEDCQHESGDKGQFILGVRHDGDSSLVSHDGDYAPLQVDAKGQLKVIADLDVDFDYVYHEDSPFTNLDIGAYVLSVRQDTLAIDTTLTGDFSSFKVNDRGALWSVPVGTVADGVADNENPVKIGSKTVWGALVTTAVNGDRANLISDKFRRVYVNNGANIGIVPQPVTVTDTPVALPTTPQAGRRQLLIQNLYNRPIYVGGVTVAVTTGFRVAAGATITLEAGQDIAVYAIADAGVSAPCRVLELA